MSKRVLAGFLLTLLGVNASAAIIRDVDELTAETRLIYGSLQLYEEGELMKRSARKQFYLLILPADANQAIAYRVNREVSGEFFISLDPGEYTLLGYHWNHKELVNTGRIEADFDAPAAGGDVCIGSIDIDIATGRERLVMEDRFEEVSAAYDARFPERRGTSVKQLLREWERIGDAEYIGHPCHPHWQIECEKRFRGIVPISPAVQRQEFTQVDNRRPSFSWKPSPLEGVSYDIVLYEAASYGSRMSSRLDRTYVRGRVAAYRQGLRDPSWQPETPLESSAKYFWSVRFRDGNTVSEWSTHSHSFNIILVWSAAYGQWFRFETP